MSFDVTILMPVYNGEKYIAEAIDSVLAQTFTDFEFLIVNDGSTDSTEKIISSYNDPRIKLVNQVNGGVSCALNTGLSLAKGKFIARFDSDDICYPERLMEQVAFMKQNPDYVLIGSDADYVTEQGDFVFYYENTGHSDTEIRERIYEKNPIIHSTVLFVKDVIINAGAYDKGAHTFEDHLLWVKVIKYGKVCNVKKPFIKVRLNSDSVTTDERLRGKRFLELRRQILLRGDVVKPEESAELLKIIRSQNSGALKKLGYLLFVSKKYLWNNYQPALARKHILQALKIKPLLLDLYILLFLSYLPRQIVLSFYRFIK